MSDYKDRKDNPLHKEFGIWSNVRYMLRKMAQYEPSTIFLMILGIVCASVNSVSFGVVTKYAIDIITGGYEKEEAVRLLIKTMAILAAILIFFTLGNTISYAKSWYRHIFVRMKMITERISRVLSLKYEMLEKPDVLDIAERANQATGGNYDSVEGMIKFMGYIATNIFTVIVTFVAVTVLDRRLIIALILLGIVQFVYYRKVVKKDKEEVWDRLSPVWRKTNYMERVTRDFDFAKDIRLFSLSGFLADKQQKIYDVRAERIDHHEEMWFRYVFFTRVAYVVIQACIYVTLYLAVFQNNLRIGDFTMFMSFALTFSAAFTNMLQNFGNLKKNSLFVDDFRSFMELDLGDDEQAGICLPDTESFEIEFVNVSYRYLKSEKYALKNLNLKIRSGEKLAVVGLNGAGKTTMIKLLLRLYDPTEGYITLNGTDIREFNREEYYRAFAPVFQDIEIFAFLFGENISLKTMQNTDKGKALACAEEAGLKEKIEALVKGLDTPLTKIVEEDGVDLSGGEKQKTALARALYKGAKFVVLDEPTSALDAIAEQQLYNRFDEMIGKKSAVYISHRLASTKFCDRVAMFADGEMIEYGTHEELMRVEGEYARMFNTQAQYYREGSEVIENA